MKTKLETCKNCEKEFKESYEFCPYCGQKAKDELTLGVLFYNTISNYFSFDARFFKSFFPLLFKPGYLPERFIQGKRLLYLHPAQMYLFISVVFFFLFSFISRDQVQSIDKVFQKELKLPIVTDSVTHDLVIDTVNSNKLSKKLKDNNIITSVGQENIKTFDSLIKTNNEVNISGVNFGFERKKIDSLIAINAPDKDVYIAMGMDSDAGSFSRKIYKQILKFYKQRNGGSILQAFYDTIPIAMFVLLPIFAFILKLLYFKRGNFSHHLVFSFYFFSFLFMVFSFVVLVDLIWGFLFWLALILIFTTFFYLLLAVKRFYKQGYFLSFLKSGLATFAFLLFVAPLATVIMFLFAFLFY